MSKRVALYARVSTASQTTENQLLDLRQTAQRMGYTIVAEFVDNGISGAKGRCDRPALDQMLKQATQRRFDMILCWDISRLGRSLQNLVEILTELQSLKIDLFFQQQGLDTSTSSGRMMFSVFGALAEYERELIRERVIAGQQRANGSRYKTWSPIKNERRVTDCYQTAARKGCGYQADCSAVPGRYRFCLLCPCLMILGIKRNRWQTVSERLEWSVFHLLNILDSLIYLLSLSALKSGFAYAYLFRHEGGSY